MPNQVEKHPLNALGRFYVDQDTCLDHECCIEVAPKNLKMDSKTWGAYIFKQPESEAEEVECIEAMQVCPVEAIFDDGEEIGEKSFFVSLWELISSKIN